MKFLFIDKGKQKAQSHQIILTLDITLLNLNDILIIKFFEIQSNGWWWFDDFKIRLDARSWLGKSLKGAAPIKC